MHLLQLSCIQHAASTWAALSAHATPCSTLGDGLGCGLLRGASRSCCIAPGGEQDQRAGGVRDAGQAVPQEKQEAGEGEEGKHGGLGSIIPCQSKSSKTQADPCFGESRAKSVGNNPCAQPSRPWHKGQPSQELLTLSYRRSDPCSQIHFPSRLQTWSPMMDPRNQRTRTRASTAAARTARTSHHGLPLLP